MSEITAVWLEECAMVPGTWKRPDYNVVVNSATTDITHTGPDWAQTYEADRLDYIIMDKRHMDAIRALDRREHNKRESGPPRNRKERRAGRRF